MTETDLEVHRLRLAKGGGIASMKADAEWRKRRAKEKETSEQRLIDAMTNAQKSEEIGLGEYTLLLHWRRSDWQQKIGIIGLYITIFFLGFSCASGDWIKRFIELMIEIFS